MFSLQSPITLPLLFIFLPLTVAGQFLLPYEIDFTDSSGRLLSPGGGIAATSKDADSLDLWSVGAGGALVNVAAWTSKNGWSKLAPAIFGPHPGPFVPGGGIAAEIRDPSINMVDAFALGNGGYLWNIGSFDGKNWHGPYQQQPWRSISANTFIKGGGLAANSRNTSLTDVFTIAKDGCLWFAGGWDASNGFKPPFKWPAPGNCNFIAGGGVAVNSRTPSMNDTWTIARDGYLWNVGWFDGRFHPPYPHPKKLPHPFPPGTPLAAVSRDSTRVDVYAIDSDGSVWMVGGFVNATPIAPYRMPTSSPGSFRGSLAASARNPASTDIWAIAPDGAAWNAGSWNAAMSNTDNPASCTHLPLPVHVALTPAPPLPTVAYARRLGRLSTGPQTNAAAAHVAALDLGSAIETPGRISFLFGDTRDTSIPSPGWDSLAITTQSEVARDVLPRLTYSTTNGSFTPFTIPGIDLGINNTPQDGVILPNGQTVVFLGTGAELVPKRANSIMAVTARTTAPLPALSVDHVVQTQFFVYVSSYFEPADGYVYIFGTGPNFRQSSGVYLARATARCVQDRSSWTYFTGNSASTFVTGENHARMLFTGPHNNLGELSVRKIGSQYVMLYQASPISPSQQVERGVFARFATSVVGAWSAPLRVWSPGPSVAPFAGVGYGSSMHSGQQSNAAPDDGLAEPDLSLNPNDPDFERKNKYGGEYAPEIITRWSTANKGLTALKYGLSLGNPYQVDLFESVLAESGVTPPSLPTGNLPERRLLNPSFAGSDPLRGWSMSGGPFVPVNQCNGHYLSTYGSLGSNTMGSLQQSFVPGAQTKSLCFSLWGGKINTPQFGSIEPNVSVRLLHNGMIVRESRPTNNNMNPPACAPSANSAGAPVAWDLTEFIGEQVTLEIHDSRQDAFGFVLVSPFRQSCQ